jgi:hypothetical protein
MDELQPCNLSLLGQYSGRPNPIFELDTLGFSRDNFRFLGWHILTLTAVENSHVCSQAKGGSGCVNRRIATSNDGYPLPNLNLLT